MKARTIEATGKRWKAAQAVGVLAIIGGAAVAIAAGMVDGSPAMLGAGMAAVGLGLPVWIVGRVGGWWFHG